MARVPIYRREPAEGAGDSLAGGWPAPSVEQRRNASFDITLQECSDMVHRVLAEEGA